jgi:predicted Zn-dependent protease with MMP-like domain
VGAIRHLARAVAFTVGSIVVAALLGLAVFELIAGLGSPWLRLPAALFIVACGVLLYRALSRHRPARVPAVVTKARPTAAVEPLGFAGVSDPEVEAIVSRAVAELPPEFREQIANLAFVIEDEPPPGKSWLATYQGIPLTEKSVFRAWDWPHKITIYRGPLRRLYGYDPERFEYEVSHTVRHELAHYFGISDERLVELGAY